MYFCALSIRRTFPSPNFLWITVAPATTPDKSSSGFFGSSFAVTVVVTVGLTPYVAVMESLALGAGIAPSYIPVLENGEKCPTIETLDAICFAFGITLADFFTEKKADTLIDRVSALTDKQKHLLNEFLNSL